MWRGIGSYSTRIQLAQSCHILYNDSMELPLGGIGHSLLRGVMLMQYVTYDTLFVIATFVIALIALLKKRDK